MAPVDAETYFRDHWITIEPERIDRYRRSFRITDTNRTTFLDPLEARDGEVVVDYGCGPGYVSVELAKIVGPGGAVHAIDISPDLLHVARTLAEEAGVADRVRFHEVTDGLLPLPDASVDRVVFKSVLLYMPDIDATLADACRVLKPGGAVVALDSDFGLSACTAYSADEWREFLDAARPAFRDPTMGRNLPAALKRAGLVDIETQVAVRNDGEGHFRGTLENFLGYVRELGTMPPDRLDEMAVQADRAIDDGDWLFVLTFFRVAGVKPSG